MAPAKICTRPSCGASLPLAGPSSSPGEPTYSLSGTCTHHPGQPVFHEGQKSWSCCSQVNKPVLDFDDFVKIGGCTTVQGHSIDKVSKDEKKTLDEAPKGVIGEDGKEVFGAPATSTGTSSSSSAVTGAQNGMGSTGGVAKPIVDPSIAAGSSSPAAATTAPSVEPSDPPGASIPSGTTCKRPGCTSLSSGGERDIQKEKCHYHRGFPIFHEGSKGYSCCKRRVLDFADFLKIEPCTTSASGHLFVQPLKSSRKPDAGESAIAAGRAGDDLLKSRGMTLREGEEEADCRMDHYETPDEIRMTVYCKGVKMEDSVITIEEGDVLLSLSLPPAPASSTAPRRHLLHLPLYAALDPTNSSYQVSPSRIKIDLILRKKQAGASWPILIRGGPLNGYGLTFGRK